MSWPAICNDSVFVGNINSQVCIVTLWTKKEEVMKKVPKEKYALIGQLYSKYGGLSAFLRNCLSNKNIRHIIVTGNDLSGSGETLITFFEQGVDENHVIVGTHVDIEKEIPKESLDNLRKHVNIHDQRSLKDFSQLPDLITTFKKIENYGEPETFPEAVITPPEIFPNEGQGFCIHETRIHSAWLRLLHHSLRFGFKQTEDNEKDKRVLLSVSSIVNAAEMQWKNYFPIAQNSAELEDSYFSLETIVEELKEKQFFSNNLMKISLFAYHAKLFVSVVFEELELFRDFLKYSFRFFQVKDALMKFYQCKDFSLSFFIHKLYISSGDLANAKTILEKNPVLMQRIGDPRTNFAISIDQDHIKILHVNNDGKLLDVFYAKDAFDAYKQLVLKERVSQISHACYLGAELMKAEIALKKGLKYVQDDDLEL